MSGTRIFLDTNILCYAADFNAGEKQHRAQSIVHEMDIAKCGQISTQVLQETYNVITRKLKYSIDRARMYIESVRVFDVHNNTADDIMEAIDISCKNQISIWDALIVTAAKACGCGTLYTEDLNDGQVIEGIKVVNPFGSGR